MATLPRPRTWTYADIADWPESNGDRYEIIEGELVVTPPPVPVHQSLTTELLLAVGPIVRSEDLGRLFPAQIGVLLAENVMLIPDLVFVRRERLHIVGRTLIEGPPDLVVEILSPSTRKRDLGQKLRLYARFGILEY
jgi:Uma2 family endonuclease